MTKNQHSSHLGLRFLTAIHVWIQFHLSYLIENSFLNFSYFHVDVKLFGPSVCTWALCTCFQ